MFREAPQYGVPQMTRRAWLTSLLAVAATPRPASAQRGFQLTDMRITATESERVERYVTVGKAFTWVVNDKALWAQLEPLIGRTVTIRVEPT